MLRGSIKENVVMEYFSKDDRVLLVYPAYPGETQKPDRPPLGLLTVAAPLLEKGVDVCILDERAEKDFDARLAEELKKNPLCVGISSMSGRHITGALRVSRLVKEQSDVPVVWGGVHPSLEPESTVRHELVDIIVRDDGEETFPELLACLKEHEDKLEHVRGIGYKKNNLVVITEPAEAARIENLPLIPFHLIDFDKYHAREPWTSEKNILPMETSRGCPFSCSFCTESVRKKKWRELSPERVISDIKHYVKKYGIRNFTFIDDNLFGNVKRGEKIVELLVRENVAIKWYTNIRTDYVVHVDSDFIRLLEHSGCGMLTFGAESGSERILKMVNKHATKEEVIATNRKLRYSNIFSHFVTIRGFPTETPEDIASTFLLNIQLLLENKKAICDSPFLIPTPGTVIGRQCLRGAADRYSLEDWAGIFDMERGGRPPWVLKETFDFIKRYDKVVSIISRMNRKGVPLWHNTIYRFLLKFIRVILKPDQIR